MKKLLLGVTSGIGAKDTIELVTCLKQDEFDIKLIVTKKATEFFDQSNLNESVEIFNDETEWYTWRKQGDEILHINLRNWADVMLIAPLSANTLAKLVNGISDNLLLTTARAWMWHKKHFVVAPSMNKFMWEHPVTREHLNKLHKWGIKEIPPRCKLLAGGDFGIGALERPEIISKYMCELMEDM